MISSLLEAGLFALVGAVIGAIVGWLVQGVKGSRNLELVGDELRAQLNQANRHSERLRETNESLKTSVAAEQNLIERHKHAAAKTRVEIESLREKATTLSKDLFGVTAERDEIAGKVTASQNALNVAKQQIAELQAEFAKSRDFYKEQLESSFSQRKALERKIEDARLEHESLSNLLISARGEHESVSNLLASAESRLAEFESLENQVIALEADNAQLRQDTTLALREAESLRRDAAEMDALKLQNKELLARLESMESARKQYESDAARYRNQYDQSEQESETLRIKLDDIEKGLAHLQEQQEEARKVVANNTVSAPPFGLSGPDGEIDDLTEIVGVGKVFEATLHNLGIYHFRQIAAFGTAELARVNAELKEFKGRIEHDDWIGQARELHFKKYGENHEA